MSSVTPWGPCWEDGQEQLVVSDEASQHDNDGLLLAVHQAQFMRRMPIPLAGQRAAASQAAAATHTQEELLDWLLNGQSKTGTLVVPIVGAPGTGKSHLIKWIKAAMPDREDLVVRHIPREGTSLPRVVEILLEGLEGPVADELRKALAGARGQGESSDATPLEQIASRLLSRIVDRVQFGLGVPWRRAADVPEDVRSGLCDPQVLPALLFDSVVRAKLTRPGGAVYRLAQDIVDGYKRTAGDEEEELGFRPEDLTFTSIRGFGPVAARAVFALRLEGNTEAAAKILSDALDVAAAHVMGMGSVSLADLLQQLRADLKRQHKQLVLLFEDIAIARGLQLDLIDALTAPAIRGGKQNLCTMRVALALSSTWWDEQAPEMLSTRAHASGAAMFDLDLPPEASQDRAPDLIGRYLNAARIGIDALLNQPRDLTTGIPNVCDECPLHVKDTCHRIFSTSGDGYGLYPLTPTAARTLSRLVDKDARPRIVLSDVVVPVLEERAALERKEFPSAQTLHELVSNGVQTRRLSEISIDQIETLEGAQLEGHAKQRAETLLRAWMEDADQPVLEALGLPADLAVKGKRRARAVEVRPKRSDQEASPDKSSQDRATIEQWAAGEISLGPGLSRTLRSAIWSELRTGLRWNEMAFNATAALDLLGIKAPARQLPNLAVDIVNSSGGGTVGEAAEPLVKLTPNGPNARVLIAFLDRTQHDRFGFEGGMEALARIRAFVDLVESDVAERLRTRIATRDRVTDTAKLLVFASASLVDELGISETPTFETALKQFDGAIADDGGRGLTKAWKELRATALREHQTAVRFVRESVTRSQGESARAATAIDAVALDGAALERDCAGLQRRLRTAELNRRHVALRELAEAAVRDEARAIATMLSEITAHTGSSERLALKSIAEGVDTAMLVADRSQVLRGDHETVRTTRLPSSGTATAAFEAASVAVRVAERGFSLDAIVRLARVNRALLTEARDYLILASEVLDESAAAAREAIRQRTGGAQDSRQGQAARKTVAALLEYCEALR